MLSLRRCSSSNTKDEIMFCLLRDFAHFWGVSVCKEQWWNGDAAEEIRRNRWKRLHLYYFVKHRCLKVIQDRTHGYRSPCNWMGKRAPLPKLYRKDYVGLLFIYYFNCCTSVHVDNHTIITPTKCTLLLLKAPDTTICTLCLIFCSYMFQLAWVIFRRLNASAWLKLLLITNLLKLC
jgi:hypothetical protein